jgi:hypothetical protein
MNSPTTKPAAFSVRESDCRKRLGDDRFPPGLFLTLFGGAVKRPSSKPASGCQRVFTTSADGERVPLFEEKTNFSTPRI